MRDISFSKRGIKEILSILFLLIITGLTIEMGIPLLPPIQGILPTNSNQLILFFLFMGGGRVFLFRKKIPEFFFFFLGRRRLNKFFLILSKKGGGIMEEQLEKGLLRVFFKKRALHFISKTPSLSRKTQKSLNNFYIYFPFLLILSL
jgi:hypothetical protein